MRKAYTRTIEVKGSRYVQAVLYSVMKSSDPKEHKFRVLRSFGKETPESHYRVGLYASTYNTLLDEHVHAYLQNQPDARQAAFTVFGWILGADIVEEVLDT